MAENSDVWKESAIVWDTEIATYNTERVSSIFSFLDATWQLEMIDDDFYYRIFLRQTGNREPKTKFLIMTSVQSTRSMNDDDTYRSFIGCKRRVIRNLTSLWICEKSEYFKHIQNGPRVTAICVFTAMSGILNETVEVTTQTDFDRSLIGRNLHDVKLSSDASLDSLSVDLAKLLEDKALPDINLRCGDRTEAAHKTILAARSQVFSAMFQSTMSESETGVVDITDVDADVLETFLKYVYSGRLSDWSDECLPSLYAAGDKYDVSALKKECSERMINNLSRENCLNNLLLANTHSDQDFKNVILDFILNQMDILKSEEWTEFSKDNPSLSIEVYAFVVQQKWL